MFNVLKTRVDQQETVTAHGFCSIRELELLGEELSNTIGRQGLGLARLDESSCCCIPSVTGSYFTPEVAEEDRHQLAYSVGVVGSPSRSRTLLVSSDGVPEPPAENAIALHVPVSLLPPLLLY